MSTENVCLRNKFGYCKHGDRCWKRHIQAKCERQECDARQCDKRHPQECKYYRDYKRCKFGDYCLYDHANRMDPVLEELKHVKAKLETVEKEIEEKNEEIKRVLERLELAINSLNNTNTGASLPTVPSLSNSTTPVTSTSTICTSTLITVNSNSANTCQGQVSLGIPIPQIDGSTEVSPGHLLQPQLAQDVDRGAPSSNKCENCHTRFETRKQLEDHNETYQFCCDEDECNICFTSKFLVDLHELEKHPDTTYARDHIPDSTKLHFKYLY